MATPTARPQKTVLIIDDQPFFITLQQTMLQKQGYRVLAASTGAEGLTKATQHKPDLILLDVEMPGMDGIAVCEKLKQHEELKKIPVIILTATQSTKLNERAFQAGAEVTAMKSMAGERLLNMVRLIMDRRTPPA